MFMLTLKTWSSLRAVSPAGWKLGQDSLLCGRRIFEFIGSICLAAAPHFVLFLGVVDINQ
jgi:hypothetical protein